jgi:hypothetical protein
MQNVANWHLAYLLMLDLEALIYTDVGGNVMFEYYSR